MNHKSKRKFTSAVNNKGLHGATNGKIEGVVFKERHMINGRRVCAISYSSLTNTQLGKVKKIG